MSEEIEQHILKRYEILKKIGSGAYGHVYKAKDRKSNQIVALKKIFDAFQHSTDSQRTYRQIMFLKQFDHENIVKLQQVFRAENDKDSYLIFEFMEADLHNVIRENILQEIHKQYIIYQMTIALRYLHSGEVIHRDLKPSNVLLNSECFAKLCDFGLVRSVAKKVDQTCPVLTEYVATRWYRAPQILLGANDYSKSVDMWSLGCIAAEIAIGKPIFPGSTTLNQLQKIITFTGRPSLEDIDSIRSDLTKEMIDSLPLIKQKSLKEYFPEVSNDLVDLIKGLLQFNPNRRLTPDQVLKHLYIRHFVGRGCEKLTHMPFKIPHDDSKLSTKDYRNLIYQSIKQDKSNTSNLGSLTNGVSYHVSDNLYKKYSPAPNEMQNCMNKPQITETRIRPPGETYNYVIQKTISPQGQPEIKRQRFEQLPKEAPDKKISVSGAKKNGSLKSPEETQPSNKNSSNFGGSYKNLNITSPTNNQKPEVQLPQSPQGPLSRPSASFYQNYMANIGTPYPIVPNNVLSGNYFSPKPRLEQRVSSPAPVIQKVISPCVRYSNTGVAVSGATNLSGNYQPYFRKI